MGSDVMILYVSLLVMIGMVRGMMEVDGELRKEKNEFELVG